MNGILKLCSLVILISVGCSSQQIQQGVNILAQGVGGKEGLTGQQAAMGLKEALNKGAKTAGDQLSLKDGFLKDQAIKILIPQEFQKAESTLRKLGMGFLADQAITSFNRAAENASQKAYPILAAAVTKMTFKDAMNILLGADDSATQYLKNSTSAPLYQAFFPVVKKSADQVLATKHWRDLASNYNKIPMVKPIPTDINKYITEKTLNGLFHVVKKKESDIRANPVERTTDLLKSVFGYADAKKNKAT